MRQYLTAKFRPEDKRAYTYHNDGPPVQVGDEINVPASRGKEGSARVIVFGLISEAEAKALPFETKAILGKIEPPQRDFLDDGDDADLDRERGA